MGSVQLWNDLKAVDLNPSPTFSLLPGVSQISFAIPARQGIMAKFGVEVDVGRDGVAVITFSNPPVNSMAPSSNISLFLSLNRSFIA